MTSILYATGGWKGVVLLLAVTCYFSYGLYLKPTEIVSLFERDRPYHYTDTWKKHRRYFEAFSTDILSPYDLAGLAQIESGGRSWVSPSWSLTFGSFFSPPSSSVGLMQFTKETFQRALKYCIVNHAVVEARTANRLGCRFSWLRSRLSASDSIELASADLTLKVQKLAPRASRVNQKRLAYVIHLCGAEKGRRFVNANFQISQLSKCGSHSPRLYISKNERLTRKIKKFSKT